MADHIEQGLPARRLPMSPGPPATDELERSMTTGTHPGYAVRLNAFKPAIAGTSSPTLPDLIAAAGQIEGITSADLNFPDQVEEHDRRQLVSLLAENGLCLNGLAMRYYGTRRFAIGAFTNPDRQNRQAAIDLTKRGIDALSGMGGRLMTIWLGQDGVDYAFQGSYRRMWDDTVGALAEIADHDPDIDVAIEYKPAEPRAHALLPDAATTLLAISEAGRPNLGVTLDMAHSLMANEMPAQSAHLICRHSRLLGVHLNDAYGTRDDGLMVGTVHPVQTLELFVELARLGYDASSISIHSPTIQASTRRRKPEQM